MCCRHQAWRFLSYSLLHASVSHIGFNCVIQLIIGIPLEMKNGSFRIMMLYLMGIIAGSLGASVFDSESNLVGASGAVYTIIGAWTAELIQNFDTMKYKWIQLGSIVSLSALDLGSQVYKRYNSDGENTSFAAHFVGFAAGITFGCYILRNVETRPGELYFRWGSITFFVTGLVFAVLWNIFFNFDPKGLCESESLAKCNGEYVSELAT
jgi:rhomboid-related protein 1/2/3